MRTKGTLAQPGNSLPLQGGLDIGTQAPPFEVTHPDGQVVHLENIQEKRVILAFLSPGCNACAEAVRTLNAIQEKEQDLKVLMLGSLSQETNRLYAAEHESKLPIFTLMQQSLFNDYQIPGFPFVFVLDETRIVRAKGFASYQGQVLQMLAEANETIPSDKHIALTS